MDKFKILVYLSSIFDHDDESCFRFQILFYVILFLKSNDFIMKWYSNIRYFLLSCIMTSFFYENFTKSKENIFSYD